MQRLLQELQRLEELREVFDERVAEDHVEQLQDHRPRIEQLAQRGGALGGQEPLDDALVKERARA